MRIVLVTDYFAPLIGGGVERVVEEVARRLVRDGHSVRVLTLNPNGHPPVERAGGMEIVRFAALNLQPVLGVPASIRLPLRLRKALRDADVIHAHNLFSLLSLLTAASRPKAPIVTTLHLGSLKHLPGALGSLARRYERTLGRMILRRSAAVTAVCRSVARHAAVLGYGGRIRIIPNAVDAERFKPPEAPAKSGAHRLVLFVGRLSTTKGPHLLANSIPGVVHAIRNVRFCFVGNGPLKRSIQDRIAKSGLARYATFRQHVPDVLPILQGADLVVRPSFAEGMSLGLLEAMACARPIVASGLSGTREIIHDRQTGILFEPGDAEALRTGLVDVLSDTAMSSRLGKSAREWTLRQMTWDEIAQQYARMYEEVSS